jgi:hypothetical protein
MLEQSCSGSVARQCDRRQTRTGSICQQHLTYRTPPPPHFLLYVRLISVTLQQWLLTWVARYPLSGGKTCHFFLIILLRN